jgi:hypothetical protein
MGNSNSSSTKSTITRLIMYPAIITLLITLLRLFGELLHGPAILFSRAEGGGGAIIGITWLPVIFGPYFAVKLFDKNLKPSSLGKTILFAIIGIVLLGFGGAMAFAPNFTFTGHIVVGLLLMVIAGGLQYIPGPDPDRLRLSGAHPCRHRDVFCHAGPLGHAL